MRSRTELTENTEFNDSEFTFELESSAATAVIAARPEVVTEVDESEIKQDPHETLPEGIKYRTSQDIDRSVKKKALNGPVSVMQHQQQNQ